MLLTLNTFKFINTFPANIYLLRANSRDAGAECGVNSESTMKTAERRYLLRSIVFTVDFEWSIGLIILVFLFRFEQANNYWVNFTIHLKVH